MKKKIEDRGSRIENSRKDSARSALSSILYLLSSILLPLLPGCTYTSGGAQPETLRQKQEEALRDPMNYKPDNENTKPYDISGGGFNNFDKDAFKKDMDNVLNP